MRIAWNVHSPIIHILVCLACLLSLVPIAAAQDTDSGWTVEIAQQLLTDGWENWTASPGKAVVGYALHFVELKKEAWALLSLGLDVDTSREGNGLWLLMDEDFAFDLLFESDYHFNPSLQANWGWSQEEGGYNSWLLTLEGEPLVVNISSTPLPVNSQSHKEDRLEISLLPLRIREQAGQIESEVGLVYATLDGSAVSASATVPVGRDPKRPISVVSREVQVGSRTEKQYFALYLAGAPFSVETLPADVPFLSVGSIAGLRRFMEGEYQVRPPMELEAGVMLAGERRGIDAAGSVPLSPRNRIYASVQTLPESAYVIGAEGAINEDLYLIVELVGQEQALLVGLCDQLNLGEGTRISAAVLPIRFTMAEPAKRLEPNWRLRLEQDIKSASLWYQAEKWAGKDVRHEAGLALRRQMPLGAYLAWSWQDSAGSTITAGLRLRF